MFERRSKVTAYTREQTLCWLTWLARSLMRNNLSVFYVELMQPDWLLTRVQRWIVAITPVIFSGLIAGLVSGLIAGLVSGLKAGLVSGLNWALVAWLIAWLVSGLVSGLYDRGNRITPAEALRWSWGRARLYSAPGLVFGSFTGLIAGLIALPGITGTKPAPGLVSGLFWALVSGLFWALVSGLFWALVFGLIAGLITDQIVTRTIPNEGILRSLRNALISFLTAGLFFGLVSGLFFGLKAGLIAGLVFGLIAGLFFGGSAYLKHYMLRFLLWGNNYAPPNYIRFLDYTAERVFLRKVGGGYTFTHRLLMEYFATLQPTDQAGQTQSA